MRSFSQQKHTHFELIQVNTNKTQHFISVNWFLCRILSLLDKGCIIYYAHIIRQYFKLNFYNVSKSISVSTEIASILVHHLFSHV